MGLPINVSSIIEEPIIRPWPILTAKEGYLSIAERMKEINGISLIEQSKFEKKARSIMFKSYAKQGQWMNAVKTWFEFARL